MKLFSPPYSNIDDAILEINNGNDIVIIDTLGGFDENYFNPILDKINSHCTNNQVVTWYCQILDHAIKNKYKNLNLKFSFQEQYERLWTKFQQYNVHPDIKFKNLVCSFNGSSHVSRKLLSAALYKFGYFNVNTCSKNFTHSIDELDGHVLDYTGVQHSFYRKFFISDNSEQFFQTTNSFGHVQYRHDKNIYNLESRLTQCFLHVVSESMSTSYQPFISEKFLYSVVTRGLFLSYAQPGWHHQLEKYYGFKLYTKLFDYRFDRIQNPVERLVELMSMISKFSKLSVHDWHDLYQMEIDSIEYNYNHYFSRGYLDHLEKHAY
jgi:hypothetical protein